MTNKNVTINKELVNKLSNIIKQYDPYTAYIDDYKQYSNAVDINCELDQQFIHTCKEYGYDVEVSFCYSLAKSLANGKFDSAEETAIYYINSLTKEDDSILSSPNAITENNDNAKEEETTMTNEMIKDEVKVVSTTLTQENGELTFVELSPEQKLEIYKILDDQLKDANYSSWFEEENGVFKLYGSWVDEDSAVKEEYYFNGNKLIKIEEEETTMSKTKIRRNSHESFESWINRINDLLSSNGIHLDNDKLLTIIDDETDCVSIESEDINVHGWCAGEPFYCCYDFHGNLKEYSDEGTNFESVEVEKEEDIMTNNANTTETNNSATVEKEEFTMKELVKRITENKKVHDKGYIDRPTLKTIMNEQFGFNFSNRSTRTEMVEALMNKYKDSLRVENEDNSVKEEMTMKKTEAVPATHQVICIDHAYYDDEFVAFAGTQEECNDYIDRHFTEEDARLGLFSYTIHPVPIDIPVGDLSITSDRIYHDDTIIEKAVPVAPVTKVNNPAPDDAKVLTYRLMHKIGDHALSNRKKGFGTTISAWMLCAYILKVKYGMTHLKGHEHEVTDEMKETVKDVRNWLLSNGYIKPVTFKDEKGFTFYTPEYDGNRKDKMYDATKFQSTGKTETTTYRVTKEMNKWYTK